jgi:sulfur-oxidizing protein SoxY
MKTMIEMRVIPRRDFVKLMGIGAVSIGSLNLISEFAHAAANDVDSAMSKIAGGKKIQAGKITLELPQIAENGNTVPVGFTVESPMTDDDYVKTVHLFSDKNPRHEVASFHFSPASGKASASTRMRMIKTQNVIVVAEMSNGSVYSGKKEVKVTIGGCGG